MIQAILLVNNQVIISQVLPETDKDTGEAYFNLMYPYLLSFTKRNKLGFILTPWLNDITEETENFIVYPDKIITVKPPKPEILNYYKKLVLFNEDKIVKEEKRDEVEGEMNRYPQVEEEIVTVNPDDIDEVFEEEADS